MIEISRKKLMLNKLVIVNGQHGCGKTAIAPIVSSLDRVEKITYSPVIEYICSLNYLEKMDLKTSSSMVRILTDHQLYYNMMSREINLRPEDVSSIYSYIDPNKYIKRLYGEKDEDIPLKIEKENPILLLTTHNLLPFSTPIFEGLGEKVVFIEVLRHPLGMIKQQSLNMENWLGNIRNFTINIQYEDKELPYYIYGWEKEILNKTSVEKSIISIDKLTKMREKQKEYLLNKYKACILEIPFEKFVTKPIPFLKNISTKLGTKVTLDTKRMMKIQKVPRKNIYDGLDLPIYRRCGWSPSSTKEREDYKFVKDNCSNTLLNKFQKLCDEYETYINESSIS